MPLAPVFLIATPDADAGVLLAALAQASGVGHVRGTFGPGRDLSSSLVGRDGEPAGADARAVAVARADDAPALAAAFPGARFVQVAAAAGAELPGDSWLGTDRATLLTDPRGELQRLCDALELPYDLALVDPLESARRMAAGIADPNAPFASQSTATFPAALAQLGSSLLVSTYQTGRLVLLREQDGGLNTHFRAFDKPMGMAVAPGRIALGTRTEVWDYRDMPDVAPKIAPPGTHDACYLPRNRHVTGDIAVHDLAFAGGELWCVATAFSCLATLDGDHSFVPRWKPPFISSVGPGDRCHLNGLAVVDSQVQYVTALGTTDEPGTWRARKADGGVLIDVPSSEIAVAGLSMPHSPRWYDGELYVLESGRGTLARVDLGAGQVETICELPGFTRGLALAGGVAFIGLSQIREASSFGDLPITKRLQERVSGVWMVRLADGAIIGFLRFDDLVQEIFEVALLPGAGFPEILEPGDPFVASSFVLP